jgi:hypothetical protein
VNAMTPGLTVGGIIMFSGDKGHVSGLEIVLFYEFDETSTEKYQKSMIMVMRYERFKQC